MIRRWTVAASVFFKSHMSERQRDRIEGKRETCREDFTQLSLIVDRLSYYFTLKCGMWSVCESGTPP